MALSPCAGGDAQPLKAAQLPGREQLFGFGEGEPFFAHRAGGVRCSRQLEAVSHFFDREFQPIRQGPQVRFPFALLLHGFSLLRSAIRRGSVSGLPETFQVGRSPTTAKGSRSGLAHGFKRNESALCELPCTERSARQENANEGRA